MKTYNGEKAVISLTTWKKRIDTVYKTIQNLIDTCPRISYLSNTFYRRISK